MKKFIIKDEKKDAEDVVREIQDIARNHPRDDFQESYIGNQPSWMNGHQLPHSCAMTPNPFAVNNIAPHASCMYPYLTMYKNSEVFRHDLNEMEGESEILNALTRHHTAQTKKKICDKEQQRRYFIEGEKEDLRRIQPTPLPYECYPSLELNLSAMPSELVKLAEALSRQYGFEVEVVLCMILFFMVIAVHGRVFVKPNEAWTESMEMFGMFVRGSGGRKTELVKSLKSVFDRFVQKTVLDVKKNTCDLRVVKNVKAVQRLFVKQIFFDEFGEYSYPHEGKQHPEGLSRKLHHYTAEISQMYNSTDKDVPKEQHLPQIFFTNTTPKAFIKMLEEQGGYLACCNGENTFIRSSKILTECSSYLLSVHDMEHIDDLTKTAGSFSIERPAVTILQMAQPNVALKFYQDEDLKIIGLSPRFIPLFSTSDCRFIDDDPDRLMEILKGLYEPRITSLLERYFSQDKDAEKFALHLHEKAYALVKRFESDMIDIRAKGFAFMSSFLNKAHGHAVRFAAAIHAFNHAHEAIQDTEISESEMQAGIAMMKMVLPHAEYVFDQSKLTAHMGAVAIIKALLRRSQGAEVFELTMREISQMSHLKKNEVEPALDLLAKYNLCRCYREPGRAIVVLLHPDFYQAFLDHRWYE